MDLNTYLDAVGLSLQASGADIFINSAEDQVVTVGHDEGTDPRETAAKIISDRRGALSA